MASEVLVVALALPFSALVIAARLQGLPISLEEAARTLGASTYAIFRRITLPLLAPGVLAGAVLVFTISFDELNLAFFVIGEKETTLPLYIYSSLRFGISPELNALSSVIVVLSLFLMILVLRRGRAAQRKGEG